MSYVNIALDGPSGVGKSTIAKAVARELGYTYIDTGALYRALGVYCADRGLAAEDEAGIAAAMDGAEIAIDYIGGEQHVLVNGNDITSRLRTEEISRMASVISQYRAVRAKLLDIQRELAATRDAVMDGRDIGTVILPDAQLKVFMTARPEVQAQRRYDQLKAQGRLDGADFETILADIRERDWRDSHRENAPLVRAQDAVELDTSDLTVEEVKARVLELLRERIS